MEKILGEVEKQNIKFIELEFTDIFGNLKAIDIPVECLKEAIERGIWFDGSSIRGFARIKESDMFLKPDLLIVHLFAPSETSQKKNDGSHNIQVAEGIEIEIGLFPGRLYIRET